MNPSVNVTNSYNPFTARFWFGRLDTRPLSVFRILFSLHLLKVALFLIPVVQPFYSDSGVVPRTVLLSSLARTERFSLMDAIPTDWMAALFLLVWVVVLVGMLLGYRTWLMVLLNFVFILSVQERNIYILNGADIVARVLSFWCIFIPLGDYYSIDALRRRWRRYQQSRELGDLRPSEAPITTFAFPVRMIQIQFALIYLFTGLIKTKSDTWWDGAALYYAFQLQTLTLPTADWLIAHAPEWFFRIGARVTLIGELGFVGFVFSPIFQPYLRIIGITIMAMVHIGIMFTMSIADFSNVMIISYLLFFAQEWIVWIDQRLRAKRQPLTIQPPVADDDPRWFMLSATSNTEIAIADGTEEFPVEQEQDEFRAMLARLPLSRFWLWTLRFNRVYQFACHTAQSLSCRLTAKTERLSVPRVYPRWTLVRRIALTATLLLFMTGVMWVNILTVNNGNGFIGYRIPPVIRIPTYYAGLWQQWNMFAPYPITREGWVIIVGKFEDGTSFDLRTGQPPAATMQRWIWGPDMRWRKFDDNLADKGYTEVLRTWASSYCNLYNVQQALPEGKRLATLKIYRRYHDFHRPGTTVSPLQDQLLWSHWCYDKYKDEA